jgi:hypothetical protein
MDVDGTQNPTSNGYHIKALQCLRINFISWLGVIMTTCYCIACVLSRHPRVLINGLTDPLTACGFLT